MRMAKLQSVNRGRFGDIGKLRGGFFGVWKLDFLAHEKLRVCNRVFCETSGCFRETSGCFSVVGAVGRVCSCFLSFLPFLPFPHSCVFSAFVVGEKLKRHDILRYVYIFRFGFGGQTKTERRAVGGSSDGEVKGKPLNKPLTTSVSRLSFCLGLTKCGFYQKSRPLLRWESLYTSSFLLL